MPQTDPHSDPTQLAEFRVQGLLFDLDGTLIDSLPAVERAWSRWLTRVGLSPAEMLHHVHGRRSIDTIRLLAPHLDAEREDAWIRNQESTDTEGVVALPGAIALLESLPPDRWLIVTSGTSDVATARLRKVGIPIHPGNVYGEEVAAGKPDPAPYALGAARLGLQPAACLAFEDTVAGVTSAVSAGCPTIGISHHPEIGPALLNAGASAVIANLHQLTAQTTPHSLTIAIRP